MCNLVQLRIDDNNADFEDQISASFQARCLDALSANLG